MHCVLIIVMERHLTMTLTSDHINNATNEFLRSDVYETMVLRVNLALLIIIIMFLIRTVVHQDIWGGGIFFFFFLIRTLVHQDTFNAT